MWDTFVWSMQANEQAPARLWFVSAEALAACGIECWAIAHRQRNTISSGHDGAKVECHYVARSLFSSDLAASSLGHLEWHLDPVARINGDRCQ
jgi:hypothetical protein